MNLDPEVVEVARSLASARSISLGEAISLLARRGIEGGGTVEIGNVGDEREFPTFHVSEAAPPFGTADVLNALEEE
ncbi:MAG: hypothetical protein EA384_16390 [Spirochaetaceae bacterium]|nr:MAG: hypothetical protein EA384_16390 [Spirochaetaceae bacterium]